MAILTVMFLLRLLGLFPACLAFLPPGRGAASAHQQLLATSSGSSTLPKAETGVLSLLDEYPEADGRGVKIAILDTGCDLAAAGLQTTSEGKPKYLDFLDCTGDGDVDMSKKVNATTSKNNATRTVPGLSGRNLTLGDWSKDIADFRVGAVRMFDLLPDKVARRVKQERRQAFEIKHHTSISDTQRQLDEFKGDDKSQKKELELLLEQLQDILDSYEDSGPLLDLILFKGVDHVWRAVLDLEASGDVSKQIPMAPFAYENQIGELGFGSAVTFCVQVYEDGDILSIVTDAGSHGTHVAGIAAANFVEGEESASEVRLNGVAPGAQILACKIGDGRLGSAETGTGLVRALIAAKKYGCDLINLSFGEPAWQHDSGRVSEVFADAVHKWGMTVFTSAGNDGPALSSLGSPGTLTAPITVGAFVSPEMMTDQYSILEGDDALEGTSYHFSSRGPTPDGALPDICAPGGAIAPIPRHCLQGKAQYHGTSMSSPNACGVAACILSALKQNGLKDVGPIELKRAILNSARPVDISDPWAQGAGLISAPDAVKYAMAHHGKLAQDLFVDVKIPARDDARGLYIRDAAELDGPLTFSISAEPMFVHANERTEAEMEELLSLELELDLKSSAPWVKCPSRMTLLSGKDKDASFSVRLEPNELPPGAHFATVDAIDASDPSRGPLFSLPVTVIVPHVSAPSSTFQLSGSDASVDEAVTVHPNEVDLAMTYDLTPGSPSRRFITVPQSAEWATIKVRGASPNPSESSPLRFMLHAIPFVRGDLPNTYVQIKKLIQLNEGVEREFHMKVKGGSTLEICLQLLWLANSAPTSILADVEFHSFGMRPQTFLTSQPVTIATATEFARVGAGAPFRSERLNPTASLDTVHRVVRPSKQAITSGSTERDVLPPSDAEIKGNVEGRPEGTQIYNMRLEYPIKIDGKDEISVTARVPSLFHQIYDSPLDSQLWVLEDSNGAPLEYGGSMHEASSVKLKKGSYTLKLLLRHPDRNILEKMKNIPLRLAMALPKPLSCVVYSELDKASTPAIVGDGRSPLSMKWLRKGGHQDVYISRPVDALPDWVSPGDALVGNLLLDKIKGGVTGMQLTYHVPPKAIPAPKDDDMDDKDEEKDDKDELEEGVFEAKLKHLTNLRTKKKFENHTELLLSLTEEKPDSIPLLLEGLSFSKEAKASEDANELDWRASQISDFVDSMKSSKGGPINEDALAQYFGINQADDDDAKKDKEAKTLQKNMEEQRKALRDGLFAKAIAIGNAMAAKVEIGDEEKEELSSAIKEMKKWMTSSDLKDDSDKGKHAILLSRDARLCQNKAVTAASLLRKERTNHQNGMYKEITKELITVYEAIGGMEHLLPNMENDLFRRFPVAKQQL